MVHFPNPIDPPPPRASARATPPGKNPSCRYIQVCAHISFFFNANIKPIIQTVGKRHSESQGRSDQSSITELLCFKLLGLVEALSDTVLFVNLHHFLGVYAIFCGIYGVLGEKFRPVSGILGRGAEKPHKLPACHALNSSACFC